MVLCAKWRGVRLIQQTVLVLVIRYNPQTVLADVGEQTRKHRSNL